MGRRRIALLAGVVLVVIAGAVTVRSIDQSPTFQACMHGRKHDDAYRTMYDGGPIASRWTRLFLQADCIAATLERE